MSKECSWPTCHEEATSGDYCYSHGRVYGDVVIKDDAKSEQRVKDEKLYKAARKSFLAEHAVCQVEGCKKKATEVHHKKGRIGKLLYDMFFFFATCRDHHKKIERNPKWAIQQGYSISRLAK